MKTLKRVAEIIATITMGIMTILTVANVFTRKAFTFTITWSDEIVLTLFVWSTMLFSAYAFLSNSHLGMDLLPNIGGVKTKKILAILSLVCSVFVGVFLVIFGIQLVQNTVRLGTSSAALSIPKWTENLSMPVGGALIVIFSFMYFRRYWRELNTGESATEDVSEGGVIA